jgi:uncharacterized membrane protein required for colicin V production
MLDLILFIILIIGFFVGLRRGLILQVVHLTSFVIAFIVAYLNYQKLAAVIDLYIPYPQMENETIVMLLEQLNFEDAFYNGLSFVIIFFGTKFGMQIIASMLDFLADLPLLKPINRSLGGMLGFIEVYLIVFFALYFGALLPVEYIQEHLTHSVIAAFIVEHTPLFSEKIKELWIAHISR